jgi:hypothetical protein
MSKTILCWFCLCVALYGADSPKDDKSNSASLNVKVAVDKTEPPVLGKYEFAVTQAYCLSKGFLNPAAYKLIPQQTESCKPDQDKVGLNSTEILSAFAKATEFTFTKVGKYTILGFCNAKSCDGRGAITQRQIRELAHPSPRYFEDREVPATVNAADAAAAVEPISKGSLSGKVVGEHTIRLETDAELDVTAIKKFGDAFTEALGNPDGLKDIAPLAGPYTAERITLPFFCISTKLDGPEPAAPGAGSKTNPDGCPAGTRKVPGGNAAAIAANLTIDKVTAAADGKSSLIVSCGGAACEASTLAEIRETVENIARPVPSYFEDIRVLRGTEAASSARVQQWTGGVVSAQVLGDSLIRLQSDARMPREDLHLLTRYLRQYGFGSAGPAPAKQLFYLNAGNVVAGLNGAAPAAVTGNATAPSTATVTTPPKASSPSGVMVPIGDTVVFTDREDARASDWDRIRLLTMLDLPRPEVLMNMWSLQESTPDGRDLASRNEKIREIVSSHNDALQNSIEYGWAYLSRQMKDPTYFDPAFYNYLTQRFVSDGPECAADPHAAACIPAEDRAKWGLCAEGTYCLGYLHAFQPLKPTLSNIILGVLAARDPFRAVFTTIGCMEGRADIYGPQCFPERPELAHLPMDVRAPSSQPGSSDTQCQATERHNFVQAAIDQGEQASCELIDRASLEAQRRCQLAPALPLTCFLSQAAKSFVPYHGFSTFSFDELSGLGNVPIGELGSKLTPVEPNFSTTPLGLLRAGVANFLFNYKMAMEFPKDFSPYSLSQSAQELNAELNPLVVAFNQDVAAFSRDVMERVEVATPKDSRWFEPWHQHRSSIADGLITVRGISGLESLVDTDTQSSFSAPQYQTLGSVVSNLAGIENQFGGGSAGSTSAAAAGTSNTATTTTVNGNVTTTNATTMPVAAPATPPASSALTQILPAGLSKASLPLALAAAVSPTAATAQIGRQLTLDIVPHSLPGASSAELEVNLWAQEDSPPTLYKDGGTSPANDALSRVARHNVFTRVRVESLKMFEVSSFTALVQRPRNKVPILPIPLVEIPLITDLIGLPLPGAKVYHRSTAIVSALIVPTAQTLPLESNSIPIVRSFPKILRRREFDTASGVWLR